ncbi:MAG: toll/interleukin-1 receptor domain-containing protein [Anaerolineae bacterium]|nr:MAG: toll/interleukin-1 receptor domain-containing protein [Anaerolineae bacterium]
MTKIFLSYRRENVDFAEFIRKELQQWGYQVWMDIYDIPKGAYWPDAIDEALKDTDIVVGVMSPDAMSSRNVKNEWDWALVNEKPLLLLLLHDTQIPMNYISINYIDFRKDRATGLKYLQEALLSAFTGAYQLTPEQIAKLPKPDSVRKLPEPSPTQKETVRRSTPLPKPGVQSKPKRNTGLLLFLGISVIGVFGLVAAAILIAFILNANNGGPGNNAANNAESFINAIGSGNVSGAAQYVCPGQRSSLPGSFSNFWISNGASFLTNPVCVEGSGNSLSCTYTVTYLNGISQQQFDTFIMEGDLVCDIQ